MSRSEIRRKMDEIVAFAEVERFLDTPVKRYSSGMHVRLAFAVAAHLEPEILIVDEVLAVGDAAFRDKCLGKMREVTGQAGRTILFVSHNMAAIEQLCHWAVVLRHGRMEFQGGTREAVERYAGRGQSAGSKVEFAARTGRGRSEARIVSIATLDASGSARSDFEFGEPVHVAIEYSAETMLRHGVLGCQVRTMSNEPLLTSHWNDVGAAKDIEPGRHTAVCRIDPNPLMPGTYYLEAGIADRGLRVLDLRTNEMSFRIHEAGPGRRQIEPRPGYVYADLQWEMQ
jgi:lipopolysaccharide transport system ATP-binding protein